MATKDSTKPLPTSDVVCRICGIFGPRFRAGRRVCRPCRAAAVLAKKWQDIAKHRQATRACYKRNQEKRRAAQNKYKSSRKDQHKAWRADWYKKHRERLCALMRDDRKENPEEHRGYDRASYKANKDRHAASGKVWRAANREKALASARKSYAANKESKKAWAARNRGRKRAYSLKRRTLRGDALAAEYAKQLVLDPCSYCGGAGGTIDHIIPVSRDGSSEWWNLTAACRNCNSQKHTSSLLAFVLRRSLLDDALYSAGNF